ncbi:A disintegrin and metalloproteinase with thrombospondin motifs 18 [Acropora cervicornis]|uniref:A disintegrin and metalloproteinase with thrombospondin motifs 18 n=1 Tax=Acropora cervicornis TaxID=6130 RepID=A0AAD9R5T2_ACRCE|nr:A disintegrin and metalloproteinase with thrombospondin motifs 18 [Acropora cervicornis]
MPRIQQGTLGNVQHSDPCTLACQRDMVATVRGRVKDGTRCSSDPKVHDVCIEGVCKSVGCDLKLNSGLKYDRCAICGGNSSMCSYVHGSYTNQWRRWGENNSLVRTLHQRNSLCWI